MSLQMLCITNGEPHAKAFIERMFRQCNRLGIELVLGLDREIAQAAGYPCHKSINLQAVNLQEDVSNQAVEFCDADWLLRVDDDEVISPALERWIANGAYREFNSQVYAFPRVYMWPDEQHILVNPDMWPDLQTRLGRRKCMLGVNYIHAGNRFGTGLVIPYAIEHHKLIVKSYEQRLEIARRYEEIRRGAGSLPHYGRYNLPEHYYPQLEYKPYGDGDYSA